MRSQGLALSQVSVLSASAGRRVTASLTCKHQAAILTLPVIRTSQVSTRVLAAARATGVAAAATLPGDSSRVADFYVMIETCLETVCIFLGVLCTHRSCVSTVSCEGRSDIAQLFSQFCLYFFRVAWKVLVMTQQIRGHKHKGQSGLRFDVTSERLHVC